MITLAGAIVDSNIGSDHKQTAAADIQAFADIAGLLGRVVDQPNGETIVEPAFQQSAGEVAVTIFRDLADTANNLADALLVTPEMNAEQLDAALAGSPRGSHTHLLDSLTAD